MATATMDKPPRTTDVCERLRWLFGNEPLAAVMAADAEQCRRLRTSAEVRRARVVVGRAGR